MLLGVLFFHIPLPLLHRQHPRRHLRRFLEEWLGWWRRRRRRRLLLANHLRMEVLVVVVVVVVVADIILSFNSEVVVEMVILLLLGSGRGMRGPLVLEGRESGREMAGVVGGRGKEREKERERESGTGTGTGRETGTGRGRGIGIETWRGTEKGIVLVGAPVGMERRIC